MKLKSLKKVVCEGNDGELIKFIQKEFEQRGNIPLRQYRNNLETLKKLDRDTKSTAIARMEVLQEIHDIPKLLALLTAYVLSITSSYFHIIEIVVKSVLLASLIKFSLIIFFFLFLASAIGKEMKKKSTATYFKKLLETIYIKEV